MAKRRNNVLKHLRKMWKKHNLWIILSISIFVLFVSYMAVNRGMEVYFSAGGWQFLKYISGIVVTGLITGLVIGKLMKSKK